MTKAEKWHERRMAARKEQAEIEAERPRCPWAVLQDNGRLRLTGIYSVEGGLASPCNPAVHLDLTQAAAVSFGRWLIETFGDPSDAS